MECHAIVRAVNAHEVLLAAVEAVRYQLASDSDLEDVTAAEKYAALEKRCREAIELATGDEFVERGSMLVRVPNRENE